MRATREIAAGAAVVAFSAAVLAALSRIPQARYQQISPDLFPRVCAWLLIAAGMALIVRGFLGQGEALSLPSLRSVLLIVLSVLAFGLVAPMFGYLIAGFLTVVISGFATREVRPGQLFIFAAGLIAFSVFLFSFVLKVPMPILSIAGLRY